LADLAEEARAIGALPTACGQFKPARQLAIVCEQQETFRIEIEPAHGHDARQVLWKVDKNRWTALRILVSRDQSGRLVITPQPRLLPGSERLAIHGDDVVLANIARRRSERLAVHGDTAGEDHLLGIATRTDSSPRNGLRDAFALGAGCIDPLDAFGVGLGRPFGCASLGQILQVRHG
jgi:hypothetical protein